MDIHDVVRAAQHCRYNLAIAPSILIPGVSKLLPEAIEAIARQAGLVQGLGSYARPGGLPQLVESIAECCSQYFGREVRSDEVLITPGAQAALRYIHEIVRVQGQRLLFPVGLEFPGASDLLSCRNPSVGALRLCPDSPGTYRPLLDWGEWDWNDVGAVILSQPHNPTGWLWSREELASLAATAAEHGAWLVLDETYALPFAPLTREPAAYLDAPNIVHIFSFSKVGLASERVGVIVAPLELATLLRAVLTRNVIHSSTIGQQLALAMINFLLDHPTERAYLSQAYRRRWHMCYGILQEVNQQGKFKVVTWGGGQFLWFSWEGSPASDCVFYALLEQGVAVVPASSVQMQPLDSIAGIRVGLGGPEDDLLVAVELLAQTLVELSSSSATAE